MPNNTENHEDLHKLLDACDQYDRGKALRKVYRLRNIWETSVPCPVDIGLTNPKTRWELFSAKALDEGFNIEQLELFLKYTD
jgi:hypothetical protein